MKQIKLHIIILILLSILSILFLSYQKNKQKDIVIHSQKIQSKAGKIAVYIDGEVNKPGLYYLDHAMTISELLNAIGGIKNTADISKLKLSKIIKDKEKIHIPNKSQDIFVDDVEKINE